MTRAAVTIEPQWWRVLTRALCSVDSSRSRRMRNGIPVANAVATELGELGGRYRIKLEYVDAAA